MPNIITIPSEVISVRQRISPMRYDSTFSAGSTGSSEDAIWAPPRWKSTMVSDDNMNVDKAGIWQSMIMKLNGRMNRLAIFDFLKPVPVGTFNRDNSTLVTAAGAGSKTITINGTSAMAGKTLKRGDWIGFNQAGSNRQCVMVSDDATANSSGVIVVNFEPWLRVGLAVDAPVTFTQPTWLGQLVSEDAGWESEHVTQGGIDLEFLEGWY